MKKAQAKFLTLALIGVCGTIAACILKDFWVIFWTGIIIAANID